MTSKIKLIIFKGEIPDNMYRRQFSTVELFDNSKNGFWFQENEEEVYLGNRSIKDIDGPWYGDINSNHSFSILRDYILEYLKKAPKRTEIMFFQYREDIGRKAFAGEIKVKYFFPSKKHQHIEQRVSV